MKKTICILLVSFLGMTSFGQSEKYVKAMEAKVAMVDSTTTPDEWKDLANAFERIADAEKTQWLPYYYAAYSTVMGTMMSLPQDGSFGDNSAITDVNADKAEQLINKANEMNKDNSEIYVVIKMVHSLRMMGNAMSRFMTEGPKAAEALEKAKALNPNNPRVYILEGQDKFYTPEAYGGSKEEAKKLFEKANSIFASTKPANAIEPQWGRNTTNYFLSQLK